MRTPKPMDSVRMEALNAVALQITQTPLAGGENIPLQSNADASGFQKPGQIPQTPNVLA